MSSISSPQPPVNLPPFPICALQALTSVTSHFPLPPEPVCFCFRARALCTGNCIHWEHSGRQRAAFPLAPSLGTWKKKMDKRGSVIPKPGEKQKSAVLLPSLHFPPLYTVSTFQKSLPHHCHEFISKHRIFEKSQSGNQIKH